MLADDGHDVYIGNNRGTIYSQEHLSLDASNDKEEYWDFSWSDMAKDAIAEAEAMYEDAGNGLKGTYIGYAQGAHQWLVALS